MMIVGLTGSMAMGKSTASNMLASMGHVAVHCSDKIVAELYQDKDVIDLIKTTFPQAYDKKTGGIDKGALIAMLGRDHDKWDALEKILHPYVQASQKKFISEQQALGTKIVVLDIPLLFETNAQARVDCTICVSAPAFLQQQRIDERIRAGKVTPEDAAFRLSRQMPDDQKCKLADFVVQSGAGLAAMRADLEKIVRDLKKKIEPGHDHNRPPSFSL